MRGVFLADIDLRLDGPELVGDEGDVAQAAAGTTLTGPDGTTPIEGACVHYLPTMATAGTSTAPARRRRLTFDHAGYGL
jgi:hypothetical protein